jgi:glutamate/tyrosine decarboxylase-like PLP-dependent enzyme
MLRLRELADEYGAWRHVDGAFGLYARVLAATEGFILLREYALQLMTNGLAI